MRDFCLSCHRPTLTCFCALARPFESSTEFAVIVHPYEAKSTVGTAWILRRSISNLLWIRSKGIELDEDPIFLEMINQPDRIPLLLFPGQQAFNLNHGTESAWADLRAAGRKPLFIVIDGTWTQARQIVRRSAYLRALPRVSFETIQLSEYGFKKQPHPACLSTVEGVHRVIESLAARGWSPPPAHREHDQMIEIFRKMVRFQTQLLSPQSKTEGEQKAEVHQNLNPKISEPQRHPRNLRTRKGKGEEDQGIHKRSSE
jgi:DTW domain-containing protein YfiP